MCLFRTWTVIALYNFLFFLSLHNYPHHYPCHACFTIQWNESFVTLSSLLTIQLKYGLQALNIPNARFSLCVHGISTDFFLMLNQTVLFVAIFPKTPPLITRSNDRIKGIILYQNVSIASHLYFICKDIVQRHILFGMVKFKQPLSSSFLCL